MDTPALGDALPLDGGAEAVGHPARRRLVVVVPGIARPAATWTPLIDRWKQEPELRDAVWLVWEHGVRPRSRGSIAAHARTLSAVIDQKWVADGGYDAVTLAGHSLGGVLARQAYLLAAGRYREDGGISKADWADRVDRIVLFASLNNGFDPRGGIRARLATGALWAVGRVWRPLGRELLRGSDEIANLRIVWVRYFAELGAHAPKVVQLLGDRDGWVKQADSVDVFAFPNACHTTVPDARHKDVYRLDLAPDPEGRYQLLRAALLDQDPPHDAIESPAKRDPVVFVLHGIRAANRDWVDQAKRLILDLSPEAEVVTASYGYLSAIRFAFPPSRRRMIGWFQDRYCRYLALYPEATFLFLGHSNGTYLLGESLKKLSGMCFDRVVLVGSVLPRTYPWPERFARQQVRRLRNDRSRRDWPVGLLCSGLAGLRMRDVGTGGFDGFDDGDGRTDEVYYYDGGHGKPLEQANLTNLVDYVLGRVDQPPEPTPNRAPTRLFGFASRGMRWVLLLALLLDVALSVLLLMGRVPAPFSWSAVAVVLVVHAVLAGVAAVLELV